MPRELLNVNAKAALICAVGMAAAPPAFGADVAALEIPCNQLLPDDPDLRLGKVVGAGSVGLLTDGPNCAGHAAT